MRYMELVFTYHGGSALPEQFVIVEQAARNGVFYGADAYYCSCLLYTSLSAT